MSLCEECKETKEEIKEFGDWLCRIYESIMLRRHDMSNVWNMIYLIPVPTLLTGSASREGNRQATSYVKIAQRGLGPLLARSINRGDIQRHGYRR